MEKANTSHVEPADASSMLQFLNPKDEIEQVLLSMLGLQKETVRINGVLKTQIRRVNKPMFTDEYARTLVSDLNGFLNYTIQVSRFDDAEIKRKVGGYLKKLVTSLCTHGDDAYVSTETWKKIIQIHESENDESSYTGWLSFGINWDYNDPVNNEMVSNVKDYSEELDQAIEFDRLVSKFSGVVHASFNKSFSPSAHTAGMLLNSMTDIRTESQVIKDAKPKSWIGPMFGKSGD